MSAIAAGIAPKASAQGEKIDATKKMPVAIAAMSGHRLGSGDRLAQVGGAATTVVSSISLSSTRRPVTTGSSPCWSHNGVRLSTTGMCAKL